MQDVQIRSTPLASVLRVAALTGIVVIAGAVVPRRLAATPAPPPCVAGTWTLDRAHSEFPTDIGFDMPVAGVDSPQSTTASRGRGGRGASSSDSGIGVAHETEQTLKITADVTDEAAHPWSTLAIAVSEVDVTIGDGAAVTRHFRPGKSDEQRLADGGITTHAKWDRSALVVDYEVEKDRLVRYTYACAAPGGSLTVGVSFRDHNRGDIVPRSYQKATPPRFLWEK